LSVLRGNLQNNYYRHIQEELSSLFTEEDIKKMEMEEIAFNWF